ncbi:hypothetical protein HanIR_Chr14g0712311 [Helianthus annuus]|nr:hypothetical protein HanIR_Chr14g0712311 [Helianthus annuus]
MNLGILQTFNIETSHMLFVWKLQSIINQLKIFSKITNTFPLLSLIYSLCLTRGFKRELSSPPYSSFFHHSANLNHRFIHLCMSIAVFLINPKSRVSL